MPNEHLNGPLVVALAYDQLRLFEFSIAAEIFDLARPEMGIDWYKFASCACDSGTLTAYGGVQVTVNHDLSMLDAADIIIIPGWKAADEPVPEALIAKLQAAHRRGARLVSICSGAFVIAATGLLDGRTAATHWRYAEQLKEAYPDITVDADVLYIDEGRILTSAGSAAGIDLMLYMVRSDFGSAAANSVARRLVMPAHRNGGQAQFIERPVPKLSDGRLAPVLDMVRSDLGGEWPVKAMADAAAMSLRTFIRRFQETTGMSPGDWLVEERLEAAKALLVEGNDPVADVSYRVGLGSADTLRHHFAKRLGLSPTEYRNRFSKPDDQIPQIPAASGDDVDGDLKRSVSA